MKNLCPATFLSGSIEHLSRSGRSTPGKARRASCSNSSALEKSLAVLSDAK